MKRVIPVLLLLCLLLCCLPSCAMRTDGLIEAAYDLIPRSHYFNDIYYGNGIPYDENGTPVGNYYPARADYLAEHGFSTITELKAETEKVFSADYARAIYASAFSGFYGEGGGYIYARYSSSQAENLRDENETILVSSTAENILSHIEDIVYDYSSLRLGEVKRKHATVLLTVTTTFAPDADHPTSYTEREEMEIKFVYENGWRIDSATY